MLLWCLLGEKMNAILWQKVASLFNLFYLMHSLHVQVVSYVSSSMFARFWISLIYVAVMLVGSLHVSMCSYCSWKLLLCRIVFWWCSKQITLKYAPSLLVSLVSLRIILKAQFYINIFMRQTINFQAEAAPAANWHSNVKFEEFLGVFLKNR